jgi:mRNA-degrading endonuclease YafQ of YafQ-DinJ toxin-antitoxin module
VRTDYTKAFKRCLRGMTDVELQAVGASLSTAGAVFGQPHLHAGRGIRSLGRGFYESRVTLDLRLVFSIRGDVLLFDFAGDHDGVRRYLRNRR